MRVETHKEMDLLRTRHTGHATYYFRLKTKCYHIIDIHKQLTHPHNTQKVGFRFNLSSFVPRQSITIVQGLNLHKMNIIYYVEGKDPIIVATLKTHQEERLFLPLVDVTHKILSFEHDSFPEDV